MGQNVYMPVQILNGTPLFYEDGAGEPLVLVHGSWVEHTSWDFVIAGLARSHRIVRYDRRGHGQNSAPPEGRVDPLIVPRSTNPSDASRLVRKGSFVHHAALVQG